MFNVLINDLCDLLENTSHKIVSYADDTSILISGKNLTSLNSVANDVMIKVDNGLKNNQKFFNVEKTNYIVFEFGFPGI